MDRLTNDAGIDEKLDAALERAKHYHPVKITDASYRSESGLDLFVLKLSNGRRLILARENLQAVASATPEQAAHFVVGPHGTDLWWPDLDEGNYLPNLIEGRTGNRKWMEQLQQQKDAA